MSKLLTNTSQKAEKVFFQVKSLKIEYGLIKKQNDENLTSFRKAVTEYAKANGLPLDNLFATDFEEPEVSESALKVEFSSNLKKLYKKIAFKTHPDKLKGYPEEYKKMMSKYHEMLSEGIHSNCPSIIIDIAQKLDLEDINLGVEEYLTLEGEKEELEEKINGIKNTYAWIWQKANKSEMIIKMFLGVQDEK